MALITKTNENANIFPSTKELMKAENLVEGQYVICLGYNSVEDGCRTSFKIVKGEASEDPYNPNLKLTGSPGLRAELIVENDTINMLQLGGRPMSPDSIDENGIQNPNYKFDNQPAFQRYIDLVRKKLNGNAKYKLYIPPGVWCTSPVNITCAVDIEGYQGTWEQLHNFGSTTITTMGNQAHVFAIRPYFTGINKLSINDNQDHTYTRIDRRHSDYNIASFYEYAKYNYIKDNPQADNKEEEKWNSFSGDNKLKQINFYYEKGLYKYAKYKYENDAKWETELTEDDKKIEMEKYYSDNPKWDDFVQKLQKAAPDEKTAIDTVRDKVNNTVLLFPQVYTLKNLVFSSGDFQYQSQYGDSHKKELYRAKPQTNYKITRSALRLHNTNFGTFDNISFHHVWGRCMTIKTCWELRFTGNFCILACCNPKDALISFLRVDKTSDGYQTSTPNISNIEMYNVNVEAVIGDIFKAEFGCTLQDTLIQNIHIEPGYTCWLFTACAKDGSDDEKWGYHSRNNLKDSHLKQLNQVVNTLPNIINNGVKRTLALEYSNEKNPLVTQEEYITNHLEHRMLSATGHEWIIWNHYASVKKDNPLDTTLPGAIKIPVGASQSAWSWWNQIYESNLEGPFPIIHNDNGNEISIAPDSFGNRISERIAQYTLQYGEDLVKEMKKEIRTNNPSYNDDQVNEQLREKILEQSSVYSFLLDEFKYYSSQTLPMSIFNIQGTSNFVVNNFIINNIAYRKWAYIATKDGSNYKPTFYTYNSLFTISESPDIPTKLEYEGQDYIGLGVNVGNIQAGGIFDTCTILRTDYKKIDRTSYFTLNSCGYSSDSDISQDGELLFDVKNFPTIICNGSVRNLARTPLCPLSNDFNPCYKHSQAINSGAKSGFLCYDKDAINDLKLVVQPKDTFCNCMAFTVKNNKLNIRAKIPENKSITLALYGNRDMTDNMYGDIGAIKLDGLGTYAWYSIDLSTIDFAHKYYTDVHLNNGSTQKDAINRNNNPIIYIRVQPQKIKTKENPNEEVSDPDMLDGDNIKAFFDVFYLGEDTWYKEPPPKT